MTARRSWLLPALAVLALPLACTPGLPLVTPAQVDLATRRWPDAQRKDIQHGRRLYVDRCSGCHNLYAPSSRTDEEWEAAVAAMRESGRLSPPEEEALRRDLRSARGSAGGALGLP
jgi:mono/diheme cytochrome c family protein